MTHVGVNELTNPELLQMFSIVPIDPANVIDGANTTGTRNWNFDSNANNLIL